MGKLSSISITASANVILVSIIILTFVEFSHSCHRRVEYHHFYKKKPHEGQGHEHGGGWHQSYGHGGGYGQKGYGHSGGHGHSKGHGGHKGYSQGHGHGHKGYGQQHGGYEGHKGYGQPHGGYGGGGAHKGYSQGHGYEQQHGGHKGYGQQHGGHKGYAQQHGGHKGYGQQHGGHEHYGGAGLYGMAHGQGHGGGGSHGHGDEGYGHGHEMYGYPEPHGEYHMPDYHGHNEEYGGGHEETYGHGQDQGKGHGHGGGNGSKGRKYKYAMYESTHYNDKGGHQPTHHGYSQSTPLYMQKGYGYSGPYPNTEYSSPVEASVSAPKGHNPYLVGGIGTTSDGGGSSGGVIVRGRLPLQLDAADTADLIRNVYNPKETNELVHHHLGNGGSGHLSDDTGIQTNGGGDDYNAVDALAAFTAQISPSENSHYDRGQVLTETKVIPTSMSNFDLNLNYNSADLPAPFRRNLFESSHLGTSGARFRKKLSSKYRDNPRDSEDLNINEDADISQSQPVPSGGGGPGPDYLENDTSGSSISTKTSEPAAGTVVADNGAADKMNF